MSIDRPETTAQPRPTADPALDAASLGLCAVVLSAADFRRQSGADPDGSHTVAHMIGRIGDLARLAPLVRFRDTAAGDDPSAAQLAELHARLKRVAPLLSRLSEG